jgi:hypothetical protein
MSYGVVIQVPVEEVTPRDIIDEKGVEDRIITAIKSIQKVSDRRGGTAEWIIYTRSRKKYRYFPGDIVNIRIKLTDLLKDL